MVIYNNIMYYFTACDRGLYGIDCNETCGHCIDIDECFHTNGTCLTGCAAGYLGDLCNKCMYVVNQKRKYFLQCKVKWNLIAIEHNLN